MSRHTAAATCLSKLEAYHEKKKRGGGNPKTKAQLWPLRLSPVERMFSSQPLRRYSVWKHSNSSRLDLSFVYLHSPPARVGGRMAEYLLVELLLLHTCSTTFQHDTGILVLLGVCLKKTPKQSKERILSA